MASLQRTGQHLVMDGYKTIAYALYKTLRYCVHYLPNALQVSTFSLKGLKPAEKFKTGVKGSKSEGEWIKFLI